MGLINVPQVNQDDDLDPAFFNERFGEIVDEINGNLDADNLATSAVQTSKIAPKAVTAAKIEDQQAWQAVTYQNGWTDYDAGENHGGARYYKDSLGSVKFMGLIKSGTINPTVPAFTLPAGYRPSRNLIFPTTSGDAFGSIAVNSNGQVCIRVGVSGWVSMSSVQFRAEN